MGMGQNTKTYIYLYQARVQESVQGGGEFGRKLLKKETNKFARNAILRNS